MKSSKPWCFFVEDKDKTDIQKKSFTLRKDINLKHLENANFFQHECPSLKEHLWKIKQGKVTVNYDDLTKLSLSKWSDIID